MSTAPSPNTPPAAAAAPSAENTPIELSSHPALAFGILGMTILEGTLGLLTTIVGLEFAANVIQRHAAFATQPVRGRTFPPAGDFFGLPIDGLMLLLLLAFAGVALLLLPLMILWLWLKQRDVTLIGVGNLLHTPRYFAVGWLIPGMNAVTPYLMLNEVARACLSPNGWHGRDAPAWLAPWWMTVVGSKVILLGLLSVWFGGSFTGTDGQAQAAVLRGFLQAGFLLFLLSPLGLAAYVLTAESNLASAYRRYVRRVKGESA